MVELSEMVYCLTSFRASESEAWAVLWYSSVQLVALVPLCRYMVRVRVSPSLMSSKVLPVPASDTSPPAMEARVAGMSRKETGALLVL